MGEQEMQAEAARFEEDIGRIRQEVAKIIVGQERVVEATITAIIAGGNVLLEGVPGLGKTELVKTLSKGLDLHFRRIQFTPDLMPADIIGTTMMNADADGRYRFEFRRGPIFTQLLLADEINRATPKTQSALLETMQEGSVTVGGETHILKPPFFVLATQNPIEQEGTYPLPEAQLDRFMFQINVDYPDEEEELQVLDLTTADYVPKIEPVLSGEEILDLQSLVRRVIVPEPLKRYILKLVRMTRTGRDEAPEFVNKWISWGAGPRASQNLVLGAKAAAILDGRSEATREDVELVAKPVLGHRIITNFAAEAEGITSLRLVEDLLKQAG